MKKVQYETMLPHEIVAARNEFPVAYLPVGGVEWHGRHLAVGNDTIKAHALCVRAAKKGGGLVFPPLYYGENREIEIMESGHDPDGRIAEAMELDPENFRPGYMGRSNDEMNAFYQQLLVHIYTQIESLGFKGIFVLTGHYPLIQHANDAAEKYMKTGKTKVFCAIGFDLAMDLGYKGDHAAKWETSLLMALRPDLVDMSRLPTDLDQPLIGVGGIDPRKEASAEFGREAVEAVVERMVDRARELVAQ